MKGFGDKLREAARKAGHESDADAARAVGIAPRAYGNYVNGRVPKDPQTLIRICREFGVTPNHLFGFATLDYQQEAGAIAERLSPDHRVLWFQYGRAVAEKQPLGRRPKLRRAS